jgi:hypothetical protein
MSDRTLLPRDGAIAVILATPTEKCCHRSEAIPSRRFAPSLEHGLGCGRPIH